MNVAKYVGKPYEKYDCFDLVKEFYKDNFNLNLAHYWEGGVVASRAAIESLVVSNVGDFEKVDVPVIGDLVVLKLFGYSCHLGIYLSPGNLLHSVRKIGSCVEPIAKYRHVIEGYYRHREGVRHHVET